MPNTIRTHDDLIAAINESEAPDLWLRWYSASAPPADVTADAFWQGDVRHALQDGLQALCDTQAVDGDGPLEVTIRIANARTPQNQAAVAAFLFALAQRLHVQFYDQEKFLARPRAAHLRPDRG